MYKNVYIVFLIDYVVFLRVNGEEMFKKGFSLLINEGGVVDIGGVNNEFYCKFKDLIEYFKLFVVEDFVDICENLNKLW